MNINSIHSAQLFQVPFWGVNLPHVMQYLVLSSKLAGCQTTITQRLRVYG